MEIVIMTSRTITLQNLRLLVLVFLVCVPASCVSISSPLSPPPPPPVIQEPPKNSTLQVLLVKSPPKLEALQQQPLNRFPACKDFENSTNNEFFSPSYPDDYPDELDCFKVISAGPGEVIRLRFLDNFHLEPDDECKYDYLEIRDGQYGYSPLIGAKLCGTVPPTYVESSGTHLWLRFHSDQDIHHIGFRAVYEFVPTVGSRPDLDDCSFHLTTLDSTIASEELAPEILTNRRDQSIPYLDCTWVLEAPESKKIYLQFKKFDLEMANDCTFNFVEVYGARTELDGPEGRKEQFCGSTPKTITSTSNMLHLRFYTTLTSDDSELGISFKTKLIVYYNFFRDITKDPKADPKEQKEPDRCREPEEFDCTDNTCIDQSLVCNEEDNCKLRIDEDRSRCNAQKAAFEMTMDLVVIAFIGCFLALGMCSGLILNICRKLRQDKIELDEIRASMRKSRESMGTKHNTPNKASERSSEHDLKSIEITELNSEPNQQQQPKHLSVLPEAAHYTTSNPAPVSSENSSGESKDTVIYRPVHTPTRMKEPIGFVVKGSSASPTPPPKQTSIPYSPPPPYNPELQQHPRLGKQQPKKEQEEEVVHVIEVRDCACQTRESFTERYLRDVYFGPSHYYPPRTMSASPSKRAPLARTEAVELLDAPAPARRHVRRIPKTSADVLMFPKSPSSICSSVDASTGSLELLSELDEMIEPESSSSASSQIPTSIL